MRLLVTSLAVLCVSASAMAQEKGSFTLDAMTTAGRHFGLGYYITDSISVRPSLGIGYAQGSGTSFNLGTDLRWEALPGHRVSPYATAGFSYFRNPLLLQYDASGTQLTNASSNVARYGAGVGVRSRLKYKLSLVAEGRVMNSDLEDMGDLSGDQSLRPGAHVEGALGLSYAFH